MLSAIAFKLDWSQMLSFGKEYLLTTQSRLLTTPRQKSFKNIVGKGEKCG